MKSKSRLLAAIAVCPGSPKFSAGEPLPIYVSVTAESAVESSISQTSVYKVTVV